MALPDHIMFEILNVSELPIDTRLAFKIPPKKLKIEENFKNELETMFEHRTYLYSDKDDTILEYFDYTYDRYYNIDIYIQFKIIYNDDKVIGIFRKRLKTPNYDNIENEYIYDMHTGEEAEYLSDDEEFLEVYETDSGDETDSDASATGE